MGSKPKKIKVPEVTQQTYAQDMGKFIGGMGQVLPQLLTTEQRFRPGLQKLNLQDVQNMMFGVGGQEGVFGLSRLASQQAQEQLAASRQAELGGMAQQSPLARGVMQALSPEQAAAVQAASQEAERARVSAYGVTPQEQRMYEQTAREGFQAAGRLGGNAAVASEIMGREDVLARKRAEASQAGMNAYNMAQGFYSQPGLQLLSAQPLSYQTGQQTLGIGLGAIGQGTPKLINPDTGLNLGAAERQNQLQAQMANAQAKAAHSAGMMGMIGSIGGAVLAAPLTGGGSLAGLGLGALGFKGK